jgi:dihydroflavonol-4-reductase
VNPPVITSWSGLPVCVVGGTGFLGWQVVQKLLTRGATVRVFALPPGADHPIHSHPEVQFIPGDIRDPAATSATLAGCRVVFQTAGPVSVGGAKAAADLDPHVAGTRTLLDHLPPGCRLIHTSSLVAVGGTRDGTPLSEDTPFPNARLRVAYVHAKREAEQLAVASGRDVVVTNPGYLIGPEDYGGSVMGRFCTRFWRGRIPFAPPGGLNLVDVRDAAEGHILTAERGEPGKRYLLGGENLPMGNFLRELAAVAGLRPRWLPTCPWWLFSAFGVGAELRQRLTGREAFPSYEHVRLNRFFWYGTSARAERELGFTARPVRESLRDAFHWHTARQKLVPRGINRWLLRPAAFPPTPPAPAR